MKNQIKSISRATKPLNKKNRIFNYCYKNRNNKKVFPIFKLRKINNYKLKIHNKRSKYNHKSYNKKNKFQKMRN
jgi:hypothetical protein